MEGYREEAKKVVTFLICGSEKIHVPGDGHVMTTSPNTSRAEHTRPIQISEVQIVPVKMDEGLIAFASCVIDNSIYLGSIAIFTKLSGGYRLVYPTKKLGDRHLHYHHPISKEVAEAVEDAIIGRAKEIFSKHFSPQP